MLDSVRYDSVSWPHLEFGKYFLKSNVDVYVKVGDRGNDTVQR